MNLRSNSIGWYQIEDHLAFAFNQWVKTFSVFDFHPISLCNINYRILVELFTNRIKPLLKDLISTKNSTFRS